MLLLFIVQCRFVQECAKRGLLVLLDMHRLAAASDIPELWYSEDYPEAAVLKGWKSMVLRWDPGSSACTWQLLYHCC